MKITILSTYYRPYISGLTVYLSRLIDGIKDRHETEVYCIRHDRKLKAYEKVNGVGVYRSDYLVTISKGFLSFEIVKKVLCSLKGADLLIVNQPSFEGLIPIIIARLMGKKTISIFLTFVDFDKNCFSRFASFVINVNVYIQLLFSSKIVVISKEYFQTLGGFYSIFSSKLEVYGAPIILSKPDRFLLKNIKKVNKWIGYVGRVSREKDIESLLFAISKIKGIDLYVATPSYTVGESDYFQKIILLAAKLKVEMKVLYDLSDEELSAFYKKLDCLVLSSSNRTEAYGMVQCEAILSDVPVVAPNMPGVRAPILQTNMGELFKVGDPISLRKSILKVLSNDYINSNINAFSIKIFYQKWLVLLDSMRST